MTLKRIDFEIRGHQYSYYYEDWRDIVSDTVEKEHFKRGNIRSTDFAPLIKKLSKH